MERVHLAKMIFYSMPYALLNLQRSAESIGKKKPASIKIKIQENGEFVTVPTKAVEMFLKIVMNMAEGKSVSVIPLVAEVSTQQAAQMLNVSRPHIIKLLEQGSIPFRKTGSHRRILIEDLINYLTNLKSQRTRNLKFLAKQAQKLKLGYE